MIVQRLLFFVCAVLASISVWKAMHDDGVRARMEGATSWREHPVPSESDVEKGAAV